MERAKFIVMPPSHQTESIRSSVKTRKLLSHAVALRIMGEKMRRTNVSKKRKPGSKQMRRVQLMAVACAWFLKFSAIQPRKRGRLLKKGATATTFTLGLPNNASSLSDQRPLHLSVLLSLRFRQLRTCRLKQFSNMLGKIHAAIATRTVHWKNRAVT